MRKTSPGKKTAVGYQSVASGAYTYTPVSVRSTRSQLTATPVKVVCYGARLDLLCSLAERCTTPDGDEGAAYALLAMWAELT